MRLRPRWSAGEGSAIRRFAEKLVHAVGLPDDPGVVFASMGNYVFTTAALVDGVRADAERDSFRHDVGGDLIPAFVAGGRAHVYDFASHRVPGSTDRDHAYWRDVGTLGIGSPFRLVVDANATRPDP